MFSANTELPIFIYLLEKSKYTKDKKQKKMREVLVLPCPIFCKRV